MIRKYSEILRRHTFEDRYEYLKLGGEVGRSTFGFDRWINQRFYKSRDWRSLRDFVIVRDNGLDLGMVDHEIHGAPLIHHINPVSVDDITNGLHWILDPEYLITTSKETHNAIHYGDSSLLRQPHKDRTPGDTKLWG